MIRRRWRRRPGRTGYTWEVFKSWIQNRLESSSHTELAANLQLHDSKDQQHPNESVSVFSSCWGGARNKGERAVLGESKIYGSSNGCPGRKCAWKKNRRVSFPSGAFEDLKTTISTPSLPEHFNLEQLSALPLTPQDSRQRQFLLQPGTSWRRWKELDVWCLRT